MTIVANIQKNKGPNINSIFLNANSWTRRQFFFCNIISSEGALIVACVFIFLARGKRLSGISTETDQIILPNRFFNVKCLTLALAEVCINYCKNNSVCVSLRVHDIVLPLVNISVRKRFFR